MDSQDRASQLLNRLLHFFIERLPLPPKSPVYVPPPAQQRGVLRFVRSAAGQLPVGFLWDLTCLRSVPPAN